MRKKMKMGGQVFDISSDLLIGGTMNAITNMISTIQNPERESRLTTKNTGFVMANGGQVPVEVEGGEAYHTPTGEIGEFQGPKHENGGIPIALPQGTKVFSDRLKVQGKTMSERKKNRENKINRLSKLLENDSSDFIIKNSLKRTQELANIEEQEDMAIQEGINFLQNNSETIKMALGGHVEPISPMPKIEKGLKNIGEDYATHVAREKKMKEIENRWKDDPEYQQKLLTHSTNEDIHRKKLNLSIDTRTGTDAEREMLMEQKGVNYPKPYKSDENVMRDYETLKLMSTNPAWNKQLNEETIREMVKGDNPNSNEIFNVLEYERYEGYKPEEERKSYDEWVKFKDNFVPGKISDAMKNAKTTKNKLPKLANGTPPEGVGKMYYNIPGLLPNTYYQNNNNKWSYWNEGMQGWRDLDKTNNDYMSKFKLDDKYLYNNPVANYTVPTTEQLLGVPQYTAPQSGAMPSITVDEIPTAVPNPNDYGDTKHYPGFPFNTGVDNNPVTSMIQDAMTMDPYAGTYPLDPNGPTPQTDGKTKNKLKQLFDKFGSKISQFANKQVEGQGQNDDMLFTRGDVMGLAGNMQGKFGPLAATLLNKMQTPANVNFFREYGAEGLRAMQEAQALASINRDTQLQDIQLAENTTRSRNRNSARGVNTLRSLDIAADMGATEAQGNAYNQYAQQMMQLLGQKSQLENQQDSMVMQGEQARDLADRQDIDNFYTNLAQNFANISEFTQKTGRDLNQSQYNKDVLNMMQYLSKYGVAPVYKNGKLQLEYKGNKVWTEEEKKAKKKEFKANINANNSGTTYTE